MRVLFVPMVDKGLSSVGFFLSESNVSTVCGMTSGVTLIDCEGSAAVTWVVGAVFSFDGVDSEETSGAGVFGRAGVGGDAFGCIGAALDSTMTTGLLSIS